MLIKLNIKQIRIMFKRFFLFTLLGSFGLGLFAQKTYNGYPVINGSSPKANYRIGSDLIKGRWNVSPEIPADTLTINCHAKSEDFVFYSDTDSLALKVQPNTIQTFYVCLKGSSYAKTVVKGVVSSPKALPLDYTKKNPTYKFWYESGAENAYLVELRTKYPLDSVVRGAKTDLERTQKIMGWVHSLWKHNGMNEPKKKDAISILEEVKEGKQFRCVEYGIVTTACLNALGLKARVLGLQTSDVETRKSGAGHVVLEVYLNDLKKWVFLDSQWDVIPTCQGVPLNAVEFQRAIAENYDGITLLSSSNASKRSYTEWITPYLFYFSVGFDNRMGRDLVRETIDGKKSLFLVPMGAKNPTVFQVKYKDESRMFTNSTADFYTSPN